MAAVLEDIMTPVAAKPPVVPLIEGADIAEAETIEAEREIAAADPDQPAQVEKYRFDDLFQTKIAALVCRDTAFMQRIDGLILPAYFENSFEAALVSIASRYYSKYKKAPADKTIFAHLIRDDVQAKIISKEMAVLVFRHYQNALLNADVSDRDYVVDQVATFARHQALTTAITEAVPLLDRHDFAKIQAKLHKAFNTGANADVGVYDYGEMNDARAVERIDRVAGKLPPQGITTGVRALDEALYHHGWGRRELSVLLGPAKMGKTTALINFGRSAVEATKNVLYVTLEVAAKIIAERLDANISDTRIMELDKNIHAVRERVEAFMKHAKARYYIKEFPTGSMTVSDLRRLLDTYKARGVIFDLVIVDYADLMAPERYTEDKMENSKSVYVGLRGLAMQEDIALLTATQANREGYKSAIVKAEHVADDFNKIRIADVVISINRTEEERAASQARLYFAACRNQAAGFTIRVEQDLERMRFIKKVVGIE